MADGSGVVSVVVAGIRRVGDVAGVVSDVGRVVVIIVVHAGDRTSPVSFGPYGPDLVLGERALISHGGSSLVERCAPASYSHERSRVP